MDRVAPKIGDKVLDPAAGTGGFLVETLEFLKPQQKTAADRKTLQTRTLFGVEKKPMPYLLGMMNLLLRGVQSPNLRRDNALKTPLKDIGEKDQYNVIVTNPPFGGEEERGIQLNFPEDTRASETALLFLQFLMRSLLRGEKAISPARVLTVLINDMAEISLGEWLLVLEDYHVIANPVAHTLVDSLLENGPPGLRLILSTRGDPPLALPRLRARGLLAELRAADLRFTDEEVRAWLAQSAPEHGRGYPARAPPTAPARSARRPKAGPPDCNSRSPPSPTKTRPAPNVSSPT